MSKFFLLIFLSFSFQVFGQIRDVLLLDGNLDEYYTRGAFLVYDCIDSHWVCTGAKQAKNCKKERKNSVENNITKLPCGNVKEFESENECELAQMKVINSNLAPRFCLHPGFREKENYY